MFGNIDERINITGNCLFLQATNLKKSLTNKKLEQDETIKQ